MKALSYLNKYLFKYKWRLLLGIVFIAISNYFGVEMPKLVKEAVNDFLGEVDGTQNFNAVFGLSLRIAGLYMLFSLGKGFFLFLTRQMIIVVSRYIEYDLKNEVYEQYQRLDYAFYKKSKTGDLMNRISEDVTQVRMYLGPGLMYTINLSVLFVLVIVTMLRINVSLTLIVLTPLPIMSLLIYKVSSKMNRLSTIKQEEQSRMSTIVQETFSGIRVIKAYLREREMNEKFNNSVEAYKQKNMRLVVVNALFMPTIIFLIGLSTLLTIYYGGLLYYEGALTPGDILAFVFYVNMLTWPFASVGWVTSLIQRAAASQTRINEFLKIEPEIKNECSDALEKVKEIRFEDVTFRYADGNEDAIQGLSFNVKSGETIGIVGRTGSGKSTILNLLTRQLEVTSGSIRVNGSDLRQVNLTDFRSQIGVVPQDVFLFSDTIGNNIRFGLSGQEVSEEELIEVTETAHVYHNIRAFKDGFDTLLGERGVNLSGGQKQRISIARALIRKPRMLLLDDCLSAVDTETEDVILRAINSNFKENMNVIVSHRVSSLRFADRIIVIENGRKIEEGAHEDLVKLEGTYADMYHKQLMQEEENPDARA